MKVKTALGPGKTIFGKLVHLCVCKKTAENRHFLLPSHNRHILVAIACRFQDGAKGF